MKLLTIVTLLIIITGCSKSPLSPDYLEDFDACGTIIYKDFELGFYGIVTNDSIKYYPLNLDSKYMKDGLHIKFNFYIKPTNTIVMWGMPITITKMTRDLHYRK